MTDARIKAWNNPSEWLDLSSLNLTEIPAKIPKNVKKLDISFNKLTCFKIPSHIEEIKCVYNNIVKLNIPDTLKVLWCSSNCLKTITFANVKRSKIEILYCNANMLTYLPVLPDSLKELDCSDNYLRRLPKLPRFIAKIWMRQHVYMFIPTTIPTFCTTFDFGWPQMGEFRKILKILGANFPQRQYDEMIDSWHTRAIAEQRIHKQIKRTLSINRRLREELVEFIDN